MKKIVCVKLENDMDLILAHKRAMKLCELTGFTLVAQTSIATAISEVARCAIEFGRNAEMVLAIEELSGKKMLMAVIQDTTDFTLRCIEANRYAERLVSNIEVVKTNRCYQVVLRQKLNYPGIITEAKLDLFKHHFEREPPLSPYDELRRKNLLLQELSDRIEKSENGYRILTDSLPLMMFSVDNRGVIKYTNKWLQHFLGRAPRELKFNDWKSFIYPDDHSNFNKELSNALARQTPLSGQYRLKQDASGEYLWHFFSVIPLKNEKDITAQWIGFVVDIHAQKLVEQTLKDNQLLKEIQNQLVDNQAALQDKVVQLNRSNYELEQFAHLASHDLQEPLRKLFFYSDVLRTRYSDMIDDRGSEILNNMTLAAGRMKELINDLLNYSQLQNQSLPVATVDLKLLLLEIIKDLDVTIKEKQAVLVVVDFPLLRGNPTRLRQLFTNLISNSLKYSRKDVRPVIEISESHDSEKITIQVKDNGIGFDAQYRNRIFGLFQRLHAKHEIPGTGIGLAICKKIVELHHGTISATSVPGEYSIFQIELPMLSESAPVSI